MSVEEQVYLAGFKLAAAYTSGYAAAAANYARSEYPTTTERLARAGLRSEVEALKLPLSAFNRGVIDGRLSAWGL